VRGIAVVKSQQKSENGKVLKLAAREPGCEEIVEGMLRGDTDAARSLYERFAGLINRLVWRLMGADPEHDDMVHQVFVNIMSRIGKIRKPASLEAWITGVTINTIREEIRKRKRRSIFHLSPRVGERTCAPMSVDDRRLLRRFYDIQNRMRANDRIVFMLHFFEGQSLGEISVTCQCSMATCKRRLARAKKFFMKNAMEDSALSSIMKGE